MMFNLKAKDSMPFNILRYAKNSDKLLAEFIDLYYLDRHVSVAGFTFLRPSDAELKKMIEDMKKVKSEPPETKFLLQQKEGLRYILKGAITDMVRVSHFYVSFAERAYAIYLDKDTLYIHDRPVADKKEETKGTQAKLETFTQNGSAIYILKGPLPKGSEPQARPPRMPLSSPMSLVPLNAMIGGGKLKLCPCELEGGAFAHKTRTEMLQWLRKEFPNDWVEIGSYALYGFIDSICDDRTCSPEMKAAARAILTGNPRADFFFLFASYVENDMRPEGRGVLLNIVPDGIIDNWYHMIEEQRGLIMKLQREYKEKFAAITAGGVNTAVTAARKEFIEHLRGQLKTLKASSKAEIAAALNPAWESIRKVYVDIGTKNMMNGVQVYDPKAFEYLKGRFGENLPSFLLWKDIAFLVIERTEGDVSWLDTAHMAFTGDWEKDINAIVGSGTKAGQRMLAAGITGGFFPYMRASLEALDQNMAEVRGGYLVVGGGLGEIDIKYRSFSEYPDDDADEEMEVRRRKKKAKKEVPPKAPEPKKEVPPKKEEEAPKEEPKEEEAPQEPPKEEEPKAPEPKEEEVSIMMPNPIPEKKKWPKPKKSILDMLQ
jgi:hypothetical protein